MTSTSAGAFVLALAREAGMADYDVLTGPSATSKLARLRAANGVPIAVQINNKSPRIWMLPAHATKAIYELGKHEHYETGRGHHHHLDQVREFKGQPLVKIAVATQRRADIRAAFDSIGARQGPVSL